ncbi:MAG: LytTR family transcriptional regulator [Prevotellaceae bacterium]|jgi:hypothetical protein|nr:LytTR family transcriptional regulator [Prevotellaceae bacterium]
MTHGRRLLRYLLCWAGYAALHGTALAVCSDAAPETVVVDTGLFTVMFGALGLLLSLAIRFAKFDRMPYFRRSVTYVLLAVEFTGSGIGLTYGWLYLLMPEPDYLSMLPLLPMQALLGLLLYVILRQYNSPQATEEETAPASLPAAPPLLPVAPEPLPAAPAVAESLLIDRIAIKNGAAIDLIPIDDVFYLQAYGDYVLVFTETRKYVKEQTLKYFEERLPAGRFVRVHRSCIVNVGKLSRIELHEKQTQQITLKNGHRLKMSAGGYKALRVALGL